MLLYQPFVDCLMDFQDTELAHAFKMMRKQTTWPFYIFFIPRASSHDVYTKFSQLPRRTSSFFDQIQQHTLS